MKKRICTLLSFLAMMFLVGSVSTFAADGTFTDDNGIEWSYVDDGASVTIKPADKSRLSGDVTVPATFTKDNYTRNVTGVGQWAFHNCRSLTSVKIPMGIREVGAFAFAYCSNLTSIEIPKSVTSIGPGTFADCSKLSSIEIPKSVTSIGMRAFENCSNLTSIEIPKSVTNIESNAFANCSKLSSIEIPDGVTSIGWWTFAGCSNLSSIEIPKSVTNISGHAFENCSNLSSIKIPDGVTFISLSAFENCSNLTSIEIPKSVTNIESRAFFNCKNLSSVTIPWTVFSIDKNAFLDCDGLRTVFYPASFDISQTVFPSTATKIAYEIRNKNSTPIEIVPKDVKLGDKVTTLTVCPNIVGPYYKLVTPHYYVSGLTYGHDWNKTTSTSPNTCTVCGTAKCGPADHKWQRATCYSPLTCYVCGEKGGVPLPHSWKKATCTAPMTCTVCGKTYGGPLGHDRGENNGQCKRCGVATLQAPNSWYTTVQSVFGEDLKLIVEDPYSTVPKDAIIMVDWVKPGTARHQELSTMLDTTHDAKHITFLEIILCDKNKKPLSMPLTGKVHVLLQLPKDYDKNGTQVSLVRSDADVEFDEEVVTRDGVDYISFWSDHFSPYSFVDTRSAEENNAINNTNDSTAINTVSNESTTRETSSAKIAPKTGDSYKKLYIALGSLLVALAALIFMHLKRKKHCIK